MRSRFFGFTLIELLVSISIIGLLSAVGLSSYIQFNRRQILASAVRTLLNDLRLAQSKAESGERPEKCVGDLSGYQVTIQTSGYKIEANCSSLVKIKEVNFPEVVSKKSGFNWVKFKTLRGGVEVNPAGQYSLILTAFGIDRTIMISSAGEISSK
jgi:prepilin-type N-terminal cleavage/methylation domain-containing protein